MGTPAMRKIGSVGDVNPVEYGGGCIFTQWESGGPWVEYTHGLESEHPDATEDDPNASLTVYRVGLEKNGPSFLGWYDWIDWEEVAESVDADVKVYGPSRLKTSQARSLALQDAADFYGWHEFDHYPETFTVRELEQRWQLS